MTRVRRRDSGSRPTGPKDGAPPPRGQEANNQSDKYVAAVSRKNLEYPLNAVLDQVPAVVYGAVIAYALYVLARLVVELQAHYRVTDADYPGLSLQDAVPAFLVFAVVLIYMFEDIGEVMKIASKFPMRRTSRYYHELVIACFYVVAFALIEERSTIAWAAFAFAVGWGGVWLNQLKEEYQDHRSLVAELAKTQRGLQYSGGAVFLGEWGLLYLHTKSLNIDLLSAVWYAATFIAWLLVATAYPIMRNGANCSGLIVSVFPDKLLIHFMNKMEKFRLKGAEPWTRF